MENDHLWSFSHNFCAKFNVKNFRHYGVPVKNILEDFENASPYFCTFLANRIWD